MSYEYIPAVGFALTTIVAGYQWSYWKSTAKARLALLEEVRECYDMATLREVELGNRLSEARARIQENETDLANFAEYKRIAQSVKAKAAKPRKTARKKAAVAK